MCLNVIDTIDNDNSGCLKKVSNIMNYQMTSVYMWKKDNYSLHYLEINKVRECEKKLEKKMSYIYDNRNGLKWLVLGLVF